MTPTEFKALKPQFTGVDNAVVQSYLDMAAELVFDPENDMAVAALTCHMMTLDGRGTDAQSQSFASGEAAFQTIRSGQLTLTRYQRSSGGGRFTEWLGQTNCGQFYALLLRANGGGPRVARGGSGYGVTAYAKDWPYWSLYI